MVGNLISQTIDLLLTGGVVFFFLQFLIGGIKWILSSGSEEKVKAARGQIQNALIGLVIIFLVFAGIKLIGRIFGVEGLEKLRLPLVPFIQDWGDQYSPKRTIPSYYGQ